MPDFIVIERKKVTKHGTRFRGTIELDIEIPGGYEPVRYGVPRPGEPYLFSDRWVVTCVGKMRRSYIVLREVKKS